LLEPLLVSKSIADGQAQDAADGEPDSEEREFFHGLRAVEARGYMTGETSGRLQKYLAIALQKSLLKRDHEQDQEHEQEDER
jgi:hypothetical protein